MSQPRRQKTSPVAGIGHVICRVVDLASLTFLTREWFSFVLSTIHALGCYLVLLLGE